MPTATLSTFFTYHPGMPPKEQVLANIPVAEGVPIPGEGLVTLYGFKDATDEIALWRREANRMGLKFCGVGIDVDVGGVDNGKGQMIIPAQITPEMLDQVRVLNTKRMSKALDLKVRNYWEGYMKDAGFTDEQFEKTDWRKGAYVGEHPEFLTRLHKEKEFKNIDIFVFDTPDNEGVLRQKAVLLNDAHVLEIRTDVPGINVQLPRISAPQPSAPRRAGP